MGQILRNWRVISALGFALVLIVGSFVLARGFDFTELAQASTEAALLDAIATRDSDGDGLPDWQESLYGTDPARVDSRGLNMSDAEAVSQGLIVPEAIAEISVSTPTSEEANIDYKSLGLTPPGRNSLTDAFAKTFFTLYLSAKAANNGLPLSSDQVNDIANQAVDQLARTVATIRDFKTQEDVVAVGIGTEEFLAYAIAGEAVLRKNNSSSTKGDLEYFLDVIERDDPVAVAALADLARSYRNTAVGLSALSVPKDLVDIHLTIVNSLMRLSGIYSDFSRAGSDPLMAMLALKQYKEVEIGVERAFLSLAQAYQHKNIRLSGADPGSLYVNLVILLTLSQQENANP